MSKNKRQTSVAAGLAVLGVTGMRAVHAGAERGQCCSCFPGLFLFNLTALIVTVALAQVVKAKVLDLVVALPLRAAFRTLLAFFLLFVLKAKELQLGLCLGLLGFCLRGSEPAQIAVFMYVEGFWLTPAPLTAANVSFASVKVVTHESTTLLGVNVRGLKGAKLIHI